MIGDLADQVVEAVLDREVQDLRISALKGELSTQIDRIATIRTGFYFRQEGSKKNARVYFHDSILLDKETKLKVEGEFDPDHFEANSPRSNLSGRQNVTIIGIVREVGEDPFQVKLRPLLIGFPYYAPVGQQDSMFNSARPEVFCYDVDQFEFHDNEIEVVEQVDLDQLFKMPEQRVKKAFGTILGLSIVPSDWGGEHSDLVADISINGSWKRAAFAFKGPGGKRKPWTLYLKDMGKQGDQSLRLFHEPADVMVVQHCSRIAEPVRHIMDALATQNRKEYMLISGDDTVRILKSAKLLD